MSKSAAQKTQKVAFASPQWVEKARTVLEKLVAEHGEQGKGFSVCEQFMNPPASIAGPDGSAAWHFRVDGKTVAVGTGVATGMDVHIKADYESALPGARQVYTPEYLAERAANPPEPDPTASVTGDMSKFPPWLVELHNELAPITA